MRSVTGIARRPWHARKRVVSFFPESRLTRWRTSRTGAISASWSAMPERGRARCWAWRGRPGKRRATRSGARRFPVSRPKISKAALASRRAPSPVWSMPGDRAATGSPRAMFWSSTRRAWSARASWSACCPMPPRPGRRWCWSAIRSSCNPSRRARRSVRSSSAMAARRSARCAASARTGSATRPAIWRPAEPARRSAPMTAGAWCTRLRRVIRRGTI